MKNFLPMATIYIGLLVTVGLLTNARSTFALEPRPASPQTILKSGRHHCPFANLEMEPTRVSGEEFEKTKKDFDQSQTWLISELKQVDGLRGIFQENLPRLVLHDSESGFAASVYLRDQQVVFVYVHAPVVNQGGIRSECHMIEGLTAIAESAYGHGKESDLAHWIPGAIEESWFRAAGAQSPLIQRRFGSTNAAVLGIPPDFVNLYLIRIQDEGR